MARPASGTQPLSPCHLGVELVLCRKARRPRWPYGFLRSMEVRFSHLHSIDESPRGYVQRASLLYRLAPESIVCSPQSVLKQVAYARRHPTDLLPGDVAVLIYFVD